MYFHYVLDLDDEGAIRGGRFYGDSQQIDMLWTPLKPVQGGEEGNERGNPHLNIKEVLAIWRDSVEEDLRKKWLNIDPTEEDRILPPSTAVATTEQPTDRNSQQKRRRPTERLQPRTQHRSARLQQPRVRLVQRRRFPNGAH